MPIQLFAPKPSAQNERRYGMTPDVAKRLQQLDVQLLIEADASLSIGYSNDAYPNAQIVNDPTEGYQQADILFCVDSPPIEYLTKMKAGAIVLGILDPYQDQTKFTHYAKAGLTSFAMELLPRISRAQAMDVLSSQASAAGYKAALLAASLSGKFFPMLTTAAGTIRPAKVLVIGAGVAGLQAIATARRLGAIVEAYDVRAAAKEQVESLGARFVNIAISAEGSGGYARELTAEEKQQQQDALGKHIAKSDAVITTAAIPGRPSPRIITRAMIEAMSPGSVIVDLGAAGGGNAELTQAEETVNHQNVTIVGPVNLPSELPIHTSEMLAKNFFNFVSLLINEGKIEVDWEDQVINDSCITKNGVIHNNDIKQAIPQSEGEAP